MNYVLDTIWACWVVLTLRLPRQHRGPIAWPFIAFVVAINYVGDIFHYRGDHVTEAKFGLASCALYLWLTFFGGGGLGKKLWKKLTSSGLTSINAASFRRQTSEAT